MGGAPDGAVRTGRTRLKCLRLWSPRRGRPGCGIRRGAQASIPQLSNIAWAARARTVQSKSTRSDPHPKKARGEERPNNRSEAFQAAQSLTHSSVGPAALSPDEAAESRCLDPIDGDGVLWRAISRFLFVAYGARSVRAVGMGRRPTSGQPAGVSPVLGVQKQAQEATQCLGSSPEHCDGAIEPILS